MSSEVNINRISSSSSGSSASTRPVTTISSSSSETHSSSSSTHRSTLTSSAETGVKVGVKFYQEDVTRLPQMVHFDRTRPLLAFITELCGPWKLENPELFGLQLTDGNGALSYVTEKNREDIKTGSVLVLCPSPAKNAASVIQNINMGDATQKQQALQQLAIHASDVTFAEEFINQQGITLLINIVEGGGAWEKSPATVPIGEFTASILGSFYELMETHGIVSWDIVDGLFISKISSYVNRANCDSATVQASLAIMEAMLLNSSKQALIDREFSMPHLLQHLPNKQLQQPVLSFINAIFIKARDNAHRISLYKGILSSGCRDAILKEVLPLGIVPKPEVARQVHVLQRHLMGVVHLKVGLENGLDAEVVERQVGDVRKATAAVLAEIPSTPALTRKNSESYDELSRLGFQSAKSPMDDFAGRPESLLVLDCIHYFATKTPELFRHHVLESSSRDVSECPFVAASRKVVWMLIDTFCVGLPASDQGIEYDRVVFSTDSPFEEAFALALHTLSKTWKEMKATSQDLDKVMGVLQEQMELSLRDPLAPGSMEGWRIRIKEYNYTKISAVRLARKKSKEELESKAEPIVKLRELLRPEMLGLIGENRVRHMQKGGLFAHRQGGGGLAPFGAKSRSRCCKLSLNKKTLYYGDSDDSHIPSIENLPNSIPLSDIKALLTGKDCPHVKNKKTPSALAFSLQLQGNSKTLDFIAPNDKEFQMWTDGFHVLLGEAMSSPLAEKDMDNLLTWEIKLRLLGTEGFNIPEKTPEVPPLPDDFNFAIQL